MTFHSIFIHCSASEWGDADVIREWHTSPPRNWSDIGYHYVICNQYPTYADYLAKTPSITDGLVQVGRPLSIPGSHVRGFNTSSIGICYIGNTITPAQYGALLSLCIQLLEEQKLISVKEVYGHHEVNKGKTCPNFDMASFRRMLSILVRR